MDDKIDLEDGVGVKIYLLSDISEATSQQTEGGHLMNIKQEQSVTESSDQPQSGVFPEGPTSDCEKLDTFGCTTDSPNIMKSVSKPVKLKEKISFSTGSTGNTPSSVKPPKDFARKLDEILIPALQEHFIICEGNCVDRMEMVQFLVHELKRRLPDYPGMEFVLDARDTKLTSRVRKAFPEVTYKRVANSKTRCKKLWIYTNLKRVTTPAEEENLIIPSTMARPDLKFNTPTPRNASTPKHHHLKTVGKPYKRPTLNPGTKEKIQERIRTHNNTDVWPEVKNAEVHVEIPKSIDIGPVISHDGNDDVMNDVSSDVIDGNDLCDDGSISPSLDDDMMEISSLDNELLELNKTSTSHSEMPLTREQPISKAAIITWLWETYEECPSSYVPVQEVVHGIKDKFGLNITYKETHQFVWGAYPNRHPQRKNNQHLVRVVAVDQCYVYKGLSKKQKECINKENPANHHVPTPPELPPYNVNHLNSISHLGSVINGPDRPSFLENLRYSSRGRFLLQNFHDAPGNINQDKEEVWKRMIEEIKEERDQAIRERNEVLKALVDLEKEHNDALNTLERLRTQIASGATLGERTCCHVVGEGCSERRKEFNYLSEIQNSEETIHENINERNETKWLGSLVNKPHDKPHDIGTKLTSKSEYIQALSLTEANRWLQCPECSRNSVSFEQIKEERDQMWRDVVDQAHQERDDFLQKLKEERLEHCLTKKQLRRIMDLYKRIFKNKTGLSENKDAKTVCSSLVPRSSKERVEKLQGLASFTTATNKRKQTTPLKVSKHLKLHSNQCEGLNESTNTDAVMSEIDGVPDTEVTGHEDEDSDETINDEDTPEEMLVSVEGSGITMFQPYED